MKTINMFLEKVKKIVNIPVVKHLLMILAISIIFFTGIMFLLSIYTHHGESLTVPNFKGLNLQEVKDLAKEKKIRYKVVDSVFNTDFKKGTVVEQNPPENFKIKENRTIYLTMCSKAGEKVKMPNLVDISLIQAKADLEIYGLFIGKIQYMPSDFQNLVLMQKYKGKQIKPGTEIEKGSEVDLILGEGSDEDGDRTFIPLLTGMSISEAKQKATDAFLNIGTITYDKSIRNTQDSIRAFVYKQSPQADKKKVAKFGDRVQVYLTVDKSKIQKN